MFKPLSRAARVAVVLPALGVSVLVLLAALLWPMPSARAQFGGGGPPAVGVVRAKRQPVTQTNEFVGRVQAVNHVDLVARVTAFLEQRLFTEGGEVRRGDVLYRLERGPFEADVNAKAAAEAQSEALLKNASITLSRAQSLLNTPAGQRSAVDDAVAQRDSQAAQVAAARAQLRISQINLAYTEILAPVAGKITRTLVTEGNVVSPTSGVLATIVSQDPMYVLFPVAARTVFDLRNRYAGHGGLNAVTVDLRLPDGRVYGHAGKLDYLDPTVATNTDTITLRAVVPNPRRADAQPDDMAGRELVDGEFVNVIVKSIEPVEALEIPRAAVIADQQGSYVFVVGAGNKAEQRRVTLGQSTPEVAVVMTGLSPGEMVIADGIQRVHPGAPVAPSPIAATAGAQESGVPDGESGPGKQAAR